jgi:hypothetical protein
LFVFKITEQQPLEQVLAGKRDLAPFENIFEQLDELLKDRWPLL